MRHLNTLRDPRTFLRQYVVIKEKVDGASLYMDKNAAGDLKFYGREKRKEIDEVERLITDFYEEGIDRLRQLDHAYCLPMGFYQFEYFPASLGPVLPVINCPKNNLVLISGPNRCQSLNCFTHIPIIHRGTLIARQVEYLLNHPISIELVKTELNIKYRPLISSQIEGITITAIPDNKTVKIVNPKYTKKIKEKKSHLQMEYRRYIKEIIDFVLYMFEEAEPTGDTYIDSILSVFENNFVNNVNEILSLGIRFGEKYNSGEDFKIEGLNFNYSRIPLEYETLRNFYIDIPYIKDSVRIALTYIRKPPKRKGNFFDEESMRRMNRISKNFLEAG